jgi:hypothetical protein
LSEDRQKLIDLEKEFRPRILESMLKSGFGVGAMVQWQHGWDNTPHEGIVTSTNWDSISLLSRFSMFRSEEWFTCTTANAQKYKITMPKNIASELYGDSDSVWRPEIEVLSKASDAAVTRLVPEGWFDGVTPLIATFLSKESDGDGWDILQWLRNAGPLREKQPDEL